jgi:transposase
VNKDEIIAQQARQIAELQALLSAALSRIAELEAQVKANSRNSSRPPSSDGLKKGPAFPRKKGGKRGGKPGHPGKSLKMVPHEEVQHHVVHPVADERCSCGQDLTQVEQEISAQRRQVFDLPPRLLEVTEHRLACKSYPSCGQIHKANFPPQVNAPVQYGTRVKALVTLLSVEQSMPVGRIGELFANLTSYELNENTIVSIVEKMADHLQADEAIIKAKLLSSPVAHADESGARVAGKLHWIHNFVTDRYTYFFVHEKRGGQALNSDSSLAQHYRGTLVHDCWSSYFGLKVTDHALCGAHLLRELKGLADNHQRKWAELMHDVLMYAYEFSQGGKSVLAADKLHIVQAQYRRILRQADHEEPPPIPRPKGRPKKTKGRNLLERMEKYQDQVLNFTQIAEVPFTNNLAERDIRPWKTKLKVSGCFRTVGGAGQFARIKGFCSTAKKHGLSVFEELVNAINGESFLRAAQMAT